MIKITVDSKPWEGVCNYKITGGWFRVHISVHDNHSFYAFCSWDLADTHTKIHSNEAERADVLAWYEAFVLRQAVSPTPLTVRPPFAMLSLRTTKKGKP